MVVAIFRSRVRQEHMDEYLVLAGKMLEIAKSMPGFISWKGFRGEDGEGVSVHEWESSEHLAAWRNHPEHVKVQGLGRERFYDDYTIYVCNQPRTSSFVREP